MKRISAFIMASSFILTASEPSKFVEKSRFYAKDFSYKEGMKIISYETQVGVLDDEVFVGRPRIYINDSIALCNCKKEAVTIRFKKGEMFAECEEHCVKYEPVNAQLLKEEETDRRISSSKKEKLVKAQK